MKTVKMGEKSEGMSSWDTRLGDRWPAKLGTQKGGENRNEGGGRVYRAQEIHGVHAWGGGGMSLAPEQAKGEI